jgi:hypothetical protein
MSENYGAFPKTWRSCRRRLPNRPDSFTLAIPQAWFGGLYRGVANGYDNPAFLDKVRYRGCSDRAVHNGEQGYHYTYRVYCIYRDACASPDGDGDDRPSNPGAANIQPAALHA